MHFLELARPAHTVLAGDQPRGVPMTAGSKTRQRHMRPIAALTIGLVGASGLVLAAPAVAADDITICFVDATNNAYAQGYDIGAWHQAVGMPFDATIPESFSFPRPGCDPEFTRGYSDAFSGAGYN